MANDVFDASFRLREYVRKKSPGGCRLTSQGDRCCCPLCDIDRLCREIGNMRQAQTVTDGQHRSLCSQALGQLARAGIGTPAEGYGASIDWALRDCLAAIDMMRLNAEKKR